MVVGAPQGVRSLPLMPATGPAGVQGDEGPSLKPDLNPSSRYRQLESERLLQGIARFIRLSGKLATMATHSGLRRSLVLLKFRSVVSARASSKMGTRAFPQAASEIHLTLEIAADTFPWGKHS